MTAPLFHITNIAQHEKSLEALVRIDANHRIFAGHFPGRPVVPGVCQLELTENIVSQFLQLPIQVFEVVSAKYVAPINPVETPEITVKLNMEHNDAATTFSGTISAGEQVFCRLKCRAKA
ncbi:MAG: hypothetical protein U0T84_02165 [Chitinophagales bacterium]